MVSRTARVGVLMGGMSAERPISLITGEAVLAALVAQGWDAIGIDMGRDLPQQLVANGVDVAWLALHGRFGEDGCVQGLLEVMGIPYTGSGVRASAVAMDKHATKGALARDPRVTMASDAFVRRGEAIPTDIRLPVVVKPNVGGSTLGMQLVTSAEVLEQAVETALTLDGSVLIEEYIRGEEITVTVLDGQALPAIRIVPDGGFFDFERKYTKGQTRYECPAPLPSSTLDRAAAAAVAAYTTIGCAGVARADFMVRGDGEPVFLEINTIPGMTETSLVPMAARATNLEFGPLCERILLGATRMETETTPGG